MCSAVCGAQEKRCNTNLKMCRTIVTPTTAFVRRKAEVFMWVFPITVLVLGWLILIIVQGRLERLTLQIFTVAT